jgi:hypothetical protein
VTVSKSTIQRRRKMAGELGPVGAPSILIDPVEIRIKLDAELRDFAAIAGDGNVSAGVRRALSALATNPIPHKLTSEKIARRWVPMASSQVIDETDLRKLVGHLQMAAFTGDPITLSHHVAGILHEAMTRDLAQKNGELEMKALKIAGIDSEIFRDAEK